jgi:hypothetical protein
VTGLTKVVTRVTDAVTGLTKLVTGVTDVVTGLTNVVTAFTEVVTALTSVVTASPGRVYVPSSADIRISARAVHAIARATTTPMSRTPLPSALAPMGSVPKSPWNWA